MKNKYFSLWILRPRQMWISPRCSWRSAGSSTNTPPTTTSRRRVSISHPKGASSLRLRGRIFSHMDIFDRNTDFTRYFSSKIFPKSWIPEKCVAAEVLDNNLKFFYKMIIIMKRIPIKIRMVLFAEESASSPWFSFRICPSTKAPWKPRVSQIFFYKFYYSNLKKSNFQPYSLRKSRIFEWVFQVQLRFEAMWTRKSRRRLPLQLKRPRKQLLIQVNKIS